MKKIKFWIVFVLVTALSMVLSTGCHLNGFNIDSINSIDSSDTDNGNLQMHIIDVGQADCILLKLPNRETMLVDAGNNNDENIIKDYLDSENVNIIDYFINTHPHEDHIGSSDFILKNYKVLNVYSPKVTASTKTWENFLTAVNNKKLKIKTPEAGSYILDDNDLSIRILAPSGSDYDDVNNFSIVLQITYKKVVFLLTGDSESVSEKEMMKKFPVLKADVLKVGHHASSSSSSREFLEKVKPLYAAISVGAGNDYGHPDPDTLKRLTNIGATIYRTDKNGTIVFNSDGQTIRVITNKS